MSANDRQVGVGDYQGGGYRAAPIQHWDFAWACGMDYFQGQITKYVTRWRQKGGLQDLEKAQHFLEKYIELVRADQQPGTSPPGAPASYPSTPTPDRR